MALAGATQTESQSSQGTISAGNSLSGVEFTPPHGQAGVQETSVYEVIKQISEYADAHIRTYPENKQKIVILLRELQGNYAGVKGNEKQARVLLENLANVHDGAVEMVVNSNRLGDEAKANLRGILILANGRDPSNISHFSN